MSGTGLRPDLQAGLVAEWAPEGDEDTEPGDGFQVGAPKRPETSPRGWVAPAAGVVRGADEFVSIGSTH